ncbi:50S ribosomal protein L15 [bacterium]
MKLTDLRPAKGSKHSKKRVGRGYGTGNGKTCGTGHNGQNSRSGGGTRPGFEGGQMPLMRRLPKRGFKNVIFADKFEVFNLKDIEAKFNDKTEINIDDFYNAKLAHKKSKIKILSEGNLTSAKKITAHAFSKIAKEKIEKSGGTVELIK